MSPKWVILASLLVSASACLLGTCGAGTYCGLLLLCLACQDCPAGQYASVACTDGSDRACANCAYGKFTATSNLASCQSWNVCGDGMYLKYQGTYTSDVQCATCSAGTFTNTSNALACAPCAPGTYGASSGMSACATCAAGTFTNTSSSRSCTSCESGTYASSPGMSSCAACSAGTYAGVGASVCSACAKGKYAPLSGSTSCLSCVVGTYAGTTGKVACDACEAGRYSSTAGASACTQCTTCGAGRYETVSCNSNHDRSCADCAAGKFSSTDNNPSCSSCTTCPSVGWYQKSACNTSMDTQCAACSICEPGSFRAANCSATADTVCTACPTGTFSTTQNSLSCSACHECGANEYITSPCNATHDTQCAACTVCDANQYTIQSCSPHSDTLCSDCPVGQFVGLDLNCRDCSTCPLGNYPATPCGISSDTICEACHDCGAGTYLTANCTQLQDTNCTRCPDGTFSTDFNVLSCSLCTSCGTGKFISHPCEADRDQICSDCSECSAGKYLVSVCSGLNDTQCADCPAGKFSLANSSDCTVCPSGTFTDVSGKANCSACSACESGDFIVTPCNTTADTKCATCATCGIGKYIKESCDSQSTSDTQCEDCPSGSWNNQTSATACSSCTSCVDGQWISESCTTQTDTICSSCSSCELGEFVQVACLATGVIDVICEGCSAGFFSQIIGASSCTGCPHGSFAALPNATACSACSACPLGQIERSPCTASADRVCASCAVPTVYVNSTCAFCSVFATLTGSDPPCKCKPGYSGDGFHCASISGNSDSVQVTFRVDEIPIQYNQQSVSVTLITELSKALNISEDRIDVSNVDNQNNGSYVVTVTFTPPTHPTDTKTADQIAQDFYMQSNNATSQLRQGELTKSIDSRSISYVSLASLVFNFTGKLSMTLLIILFVATLSSVVVFYVVNKLYFPASESLRIVSFLLSIISQTSNMYFIVFLSQLPTDTLYLHYLCACVAQFVPMTLNSMASIYLFHREITKNEAFTGWMKAHPIAFVVVAFCTLLSTRNAQILTSEIFGLAITSAPISTHIDLKFSFLGIITTVLGDIPMIVLQVLVSLKLSTFRSSALIGLGFTSLNLLLSIFIRYRTYRRYKAKKLEKAQSSTRKTEVELLEMGGSSQHGGSRQGSRRGSTQIGASMHGSSRHLVTSYSGHHSRGVSSYGGSGELLESGIHATGGGASNGTVGGTSLDTGEAGSSPVLVD